MPGDDRIKREKAPAVGGAVSQDKQQARSKRAQGKEAKVPPQPEAKAAVEGTAARPAKGKPEAAVKLESKPSGLLQAYKQRIVPALVKEFGYRSSMEVPRPQKVVLNIGVGEATGNPKSLEGALKDLTTISGQKPVSTKARRAIANFKLREGVAIGAMVTLRGDRMWHFLDRLLNSALPRIRDFRGVPSTSFDSRGNYSLGIREQVIFPEIDYNQIDKIRGLQVNIVTTARNSREAKRLLEHLGMPFVREDVRN